MATPLAAPVWRKAVSMSPKLLSREDRDKLIERHLDYVRRLAHRIKREIATDLDLEELVAYGQRGLVEAAERYDPARGVAFTTFSYYRIRGAIFDGLRKLGWLSRSEYARFSAAQNELLGNAAERQTVERRGDAKQTMSSVAKTLDQLAVIFVTSLEAGERPPEPVSEAPDGAEIVEHKQAVSVVRRAVETLPERERRLIEMHYFEDMSLQDAGKALGLSKSWASRLHARTIAQLTEMLGPSF